MQNIENKIQYLKGQRDSLVTKLNTETKSLEDKKQLVDNIVIARELIKQASLDTQKQLEFHISSIVTMALEAVFPDNMYTFKVVFEEKRNKTEASIVLEQNGKDMKILESVGGGVVDIISFALRISVWSLQTKSSRATIILDETFKHLSSHYAEKAGEMLKMLSDKLNIQFIVVSHKEQLVNAADKVFTIEKKKYSEVK